VLPRVTASVYRTCERSENTAVGQFSSHLEGRFCCVKHPLFIMLLYLLGQHVWALQAVHSPGCADSFTSRRNTFEFPGAGRWRYVSIPHFDTFVCRFVSGAAMFHCLWHTVAERPPQSEYRCLNYVHFSTKAHSYSSASCLNNPPYTFLVRAW